VEFVSNEHTIVYTAIYNDKDGALSDLDEVKELHDRGVIGKYEAAVVDKENGKPHIVKRVDNPSYSVVKDYFDGATPTNDELNTAASELLEGNAGLIVVAESTLDKELNKATAHAVKTARRDFDTAADELIATLQS
jgi:hypothetical protein